MHKSKFLVLVVIVFVVSSLGCSGKGDINLCDTFDKSTKKGDTPLDAPWKKSIAKIDVDDGKGNKQPALFSHPPSSISYDIKLPDKGKIMFTAMVGIHPIAKPWGSDGIHYKVSVTGDNASPRDILSHYVTADSGLNHVEANLSEFKGKKIILTLSTLNDSGKNGIADWAIWVNPVIKYE